VAEEVYEVRPSNCTSIELSYFVVIKSVITKRSQ
jgi:hypothetical protein